VVRHHFDSDAVGNLYRACFAATLKFVNFIFCIVNGVVRSLSTVACHLLVFAKWERADLGTHRRNQEFVLGGDSGEPDKIETPIPSRGKSMGRECPPSQPIRRSGFRGRTKNT